MRKMHRKTLDKPLRNEDLVRVLGELCKAVDRMEKTVPCLIDDMGAVLTDDEVGDIADLINAPCFFVLERCQIGIGSLA